MTKKIPRPSSAHVVAPDRPIEGLADDRLSRAAFARHLADQIDRLPIEESFVLGVQGAWGAGKTSVLKMVADQLTQASAPPLVVWFNPWLFSSQEELLLRFFAEISSGLKQHGGKKLKKVGEAIETYAGIVAPLSAIPFFGPNVEIAAKIGKVAGKVLQGASGVPTGNVADQRKTLEEQLSRAGRRIVVIVDDIDRLHGDEVREVFRLIRLVADFRGITYLLAFDRPSVSRILSPHEPSEGDRYLEKIVQLAFDLPELDGEVLQEMLLGELDIVLEGREVDLDRWPDHWLFALSPLFRTPRDVRRFVAGLSLTLGTAGDEVDLTDLLVLEAVRVVAPETHRALARHAAILGASRARGNVPAKSVEAAVLEIVEAGNQHQEAIRHMLRLLFPVTRAVHHGEGWLAQWRREKRVAHLEVLMIYLQKSLPKGTVPAALVQSLVDDPEGTGSVLAGLDTRELEATFQRLEDFEGVVPPENVEALARVMMGAYRWLPLKRSDMFESKAEIRLGRVLLRLLRPLEEPERTEVIRSLVSTAMPLSACTELVYLSGYHENAGLKLVSRDSHREITAEFLERLMYTPPLELESERDLVQLVALARDEKANGVDAFIDSLVREDNAFLALLRSSIQQEMAGAFGSARTRVKHVLPWRWLGDLVGAERLVTRVRELSVKTDLLADARARLAVELGLAYADGSLVPREPRARPEAADGP